VGEGDGHAAVGSNPQPCDVADIFHEGGLRGRGGWWGCYFGVKVSFPVLQEGGEGFAIGFLEAQANAEGKEEGVGLQGNKLPEFFFSIGFSEVFNEEEGGEVGAGGGQQLPGLGVQVTLIEFAFSCGNTRVEEGIIIGAMGPSGGVFQASLIELGHPLRKPPFQGSLRRHLWAEDEVKPPPNAAGLLKMHVVKNFMTNNLRDVPPGHIIPMKGFTRQEEGVNRMQGHASILTGDIGVVEVGRGEENQHAFCGGIPQGFAAQGEQALAHLLGNAQSLCLMLFWIINFRLRSCQFPHFVAGEPGSDGGGEAGREGSAGAEDEGTTKQQEKTHCPHSF